MTKPAKQSVVTEIEKINREILKIFKDDVEWVKYEKDVIYPFWKKNVAPINPEGTVVDGMFEEWANEMKKRVAKGNNPVVKPKAFDMDASGDVKTKLDFSKYNNPSVMMESSDMDEQMMIEILNSQQPVEFGSSGRVQEEWLQIYEMGKSLMELAQSKLTGMGVILESEGRDRMPLNLDQCGMEDTPEEQEQCIDDLVKKAEQDEEDAEKTTDDKAADWYAEQQKNKKD